MVGTFPTSPHPKNASQAEIIMHRIRTETEFLSDEKRCYSHSWLTERDLPSGLPDKLKAKADRLYPRVVAAVGVAVGMRNYNSLYRPAQLAVQQVMTDAVEELYADGVDLNDRETLHGVMFERRRAELKRLFGRKTFSQES